MSGDKWIGWRRVPPGPWQQAAGGATEGACLRALLAANAEAGGQHTELIVLRAGEHPTGPPLARDRRRDPRPATMRPPERRGRTGGA